MRIGYRSNSAIRYKRKHNLPPSLLFYAEGRGLVIDFAVPFRYTVSVNNLLRQGGIFPMNTQALRDVCREVRRDIITMTANAGSGHPGGSSRFQPADPARKKL